MCERFEKGGKLGGGRKPYAVYGSTFTEAVKFLHDFRTFEVNQNTCNQGLTHTRLKCYIFTLQLADR